jgi:uncharacterized phage protein (TIGR01671 family)
MREIKFRGKAKMSIEELDDLYLEHENGWVYGHLVMYGKTPYIVGDFIEVDSEYTVNEFWVPVYPESVGQFTGLPDKNGKEIYEGDIVNVNHYGGTPKYETVRFYTIAGFAGIHPFTDSGHHWASHRCEIVGNIYENPELLEGDEFLPYE